MSQSTGGQKPQPGHAARGTHLHREHSSLRREVTLGAALCSALIAFCILAMAPLQSFRSGAVTLLAGIGIAVLSTQVQAKTGLRKLFEALGCILIASANGQKAIHVSDTKAAKQACDSTLTALMSETDSSKPKEELTKNLEGFFAEADYTIAKCKRAGRSDAASKLIAVRAALEQQRAASKALAKQQEQAVAKQAAEAALAQKEASWPRTQSELKAMLAFSATLVKKKSWLEVEARLNDAQARLNALKGTKIEESPEWSALVKEVDTQRQTIAPQLKRIRKE